MSDAEHGTVPELPAGVALTAAAMARERAVESARPDGLVSDPWAPGLVDAALASPSTSGAYAEHLRAGGALSDIVPSLDGVVGLRTRWIDDGVRAAVAAGAGQVVMLGAGLDTRVLRLDWPRPVTVFALDQPGVVAFTRHVLDGAPPRDGVRSVRVPVDLGGRWTGELVDAGFDAGAPAVWVIEGVLMYLFDDQVDALLAAVRGLSAGGSTLFADLAHPSVHDGGLFAAGRETLQDNGSPMRCAVADPVSWYADRGWSGAVVNPAALAGGHGRPVPAALDDRSPDGPTFWFTEARLPDR